MTTMASGPDYRGTSRECQIPEHRSRLDHNAATATRAV